MTNYTPEVLFSYPEDKQFQDGLVRVLLILENSNLNQ